MNYTNNRTVSLKKMMAMAGLFWFFFLIFYLLGALTFHSGEEAFTAFYVWFNGSIFYPVLATLLIATLAFHVVVAVTRQLSNNISSGDRYKKPYPKAVPRIVAWSGASIILIFIITHTVQMLSINTVDLYSEIPIFSKASNVGHIWAWNDCHFNTLTSWTFKCTSDFGRFKQTT